MSPIESFCWAIRAMEGFYPGSRAWRNCNPGNLRPTSKRQKSDGGYRIFDSFEKGWAALVRDVTAKFRGRPYTRTKLGPDSTILQFFQVWAPSSDNNKPRQYAEFVAKQMSVSLGKNVTIITPLREIAES